MAKKSYKKLANSVMTLLSNWGMDDAVSIYTGGKCYSTWCSDDEGYVPYKGVWKVSVADDIDPRDYSEYSNPDTLSIHFEGALYDALNYGGYGGGGIYEELDSLFEKYGLYFEMGYAWSLSGYEI